MLIMVSSNYFRVAEKGQANEGRVQKKSYVFYINIFIVRSTVNSLITPPSTSNQFFITLNEYRLNFPFDLGNIFLEPR